MNRDSSTITFKPDSAHLGPGLAICAECQKVDTVRHSSSDGISTQVFRAPDGSNIGRYLHRGKCYDAWYARYLEHMRKVCPERATEAERLERNSKRKRAA